MIWTDLGARYKLSTYLILYSLGLKFIQEMLLKSI